jgi:hypothetical protein
VLGRRGYRRNLSVEAGYFRRPFLPRVTKSG